MVNKFKKKKKEKKEKKNKNENKTTTWVGGSSGRAKAANEPTIRVTCGWAEAQTLTKDSTAPFAMSKSVGRPPM